MELLDIFTVENQMNNFEITPMRPDGISVKVEFVVDTWDDLYDLMTKLEEIEGF